MSAHTSSRRILIVDYDPGWPLLFEREAERIRTALGPRAIRIEHTGSTSVPGLAAKPVIDILLVQRLQATRCCPEIDRILKFRDWLRSNPADRDLYARTKLVLAQNEWSHVQNYADAKTSVIDEILARAEERGARFR